MCTNLKVFKTITIEMTPDHSIFKFIRHNNVSELKELINTGLNLNDPKLLDAFGRRPLYNAAIIEGKKNKFIAIILIICIEA